MLGANRKNSRKKQIQKIPISIRKGDTVMVIAGKDKGKTGIVKQIVTDRNKIVVEGLNMIKKAVKLNPMAGQRGGILEMEAPLHVSNVMIYDAKASKPTRIRTQTIQAPGGGTKRVRVSVKSGEQLDT